MFRYLVLLFIFVVTLYGLSDTEILNRADNFMQTSSRSKQFRAYNDYKNLYLRAIMNEDDNLKVIALKGIVKSGTQLHIDVSQYSDELTNRKPDVVPPDLELKMSSAELADTKVAPKVVPVAKNKKDIVVTSSHKLKSIRWQDEKLVLKFDSKISSKQVKYSTLYDSEKKRYKYIFDLDASMLTKSQNLRKDGILKIKITQYNQNSLRLVIENDTKLNVTHKEELSHLYIGIHSDLVYKPVKISSEKTTSKRLDRDKIIVIDSGHGGKDPGAVGYKKYKEKVVVLKVATELEKILKARGFKIYMTRTSDKFIPLTDRTKYANNKNADLFISIHANAVVEKKSNNVNGIECYFLSPSRSKRAERVASLENSADISAMNAYGKQTFLSILNHSKILASNKLAIDLQRGMLGVLNKSYKNVCDGGVREGPFWVLVGAQMPAVLVEIGFITHPTEAERLMDSRYQNKLATGLADGVERYFINN